MVIRYRKGSANKVPKGSVYKVQWSYYIVNLRKVALLGTVFYNNGIFGKVFGIFDERYAFKVQSLYYSGRKFRDFSERVFL